VIPYGRQLIEEDDINAVVEVLRSDWLTTGPKIEEFEKAVCDFTGAGHAVAVSSGTAALHAAMAAIGIKVGNEVIVTPMTFAASANCVVYQGGTPVFADVEPDTLLLDPVRVVEKINSRTKAIIAVDYAGHPCDYDALREIADHHKIFLIADACHSIGGKYKGRKTGTLADLNIFSFHPVKHITTGEGGMITTNNAELAGRMRVFRNHGITTDFRQRQAQGAWFYEMTELGYNYRITDIQCALGISQLRKLEKWVARRQQIAGVYNMAFSGINGISHMAVRKWVSNAFHLYVIRLNGKNATRRNELFQSLRSGGIGVNVHYIPVHMHPFYWTRFGYGSGLCPVAEDASGRILSLPMFAGLSGEDVERVIEVVRSAVAN